MDDMLHLAPASFRGASFKVDVEAMAGARRLSISPIAYAETSVIEDMGREPSQWSITAYVAGTVAGAAALAMVPLLDAKGAGTLTLPLLGARRARVAGWELSRKKKIVGYVGFDILFIEEGLSAVPFLPAAAGSALGGLLATGLSILSQAVAAAMAAQPESRRDGVPAAAQAAESRLATAAQLTAPEPTTRLANALDDAAIAAAAADTDPAAHVLALGLGWRALALDGAADQVAAFTAIHLKTIAAPDAGAARPCAIAERAALFGGHALAAAVTPYLARKDASSARSRLGALADPVLVEIAAALGADSADWAGTMAGEAALSLSRAAADASPLARVETGVSLPANVLAYRLYGDAARAGEIVGRNAVATPALMPVLLEVLSPEVAAP